ncbi:MAG: hypothetical protein IPF44_11605 [Betaproteobacteria bacterium]|nr:hypothetical protein [Betaproteobacteria bacterium]
MADIATPKSIRNCSIRHTDLECFRRAFIFGRFLPFTVEWLELHRSGGSVPGSETGKRLVFAEKAGLAVFFKPLVPFCRFPRGSRAFPEPSAKTSRLPVIRWS